MEPNILKLLPYRFIKCSSEDPNHPLVSLISNEQNEGWISYPFCQYPQEIVIQFTQPILLRRLNLIIHQTKIPSKIELYYNFPQYYNDFYVDINSIIFEKIGFVYPESLYKTDYNLRELKSMNVNENVYFLKIVFEKCIYNIHNPFNQVGICGIECLGYEFTKENINFIFPNREKEIELYYDNLEYYIPVPNIPDEELDDFCYIKIQQIKEQLDILVKNELFGNAKKVSEIISRVRFLGGKIYNLNFIKKKAIEVEDYEKAGLMKKEIEKIRLIIDDINIDNLVPDFIPQQFSHMEDVEVDNKYYDKNLNNTINKNNNTKYSYYEKEEIDK